MQEFTATKTSLTKDIDHKMHTLQEKLQYRETEKFFSKIDNMERKQKEEKLSKLKDEARIALPEGWNDPFRMIELYRENVKLTTEKEEVQITLDNLAEKAQIVLRAKETITKG